MSLARLASLSAATGTCWLVCLCGSLAAQNAWMVRDGLRIDLTPEQETAVVAELVEVVRVCWWVPEEKRRTPGIGNDLWRRSEAADALRVRFAEHVVLVSRDDRLEISEALLDLRQLRLLTRHGERTEELVACGTLNSVFCIPGVPELAPEELRPGYRCAGRPIPIVAPGPNGEHVLLRLEPFDEGEQDAEFAAFRLELMQALERKDVKHVLSVVSPQIANSLGGDGGIEEFRRTWRLEGDARDSPLWQALLEVLRLGGAFNDEGRTRGFTAPYYCADRKLGQPTPAMYHGVGLVALGQDVPVHSDPDPSSAVLVRLSYDIVQGIGNTFSMWLSPSPRVEGWMKVRTLEGLDGYVRRDRLGSFTGLRAFFRQTEGRWRMRALIAGD